LENRRNKLSKLLKNYKINIFPNDLYHVFGRKIAAGCHANEFFLITLPHMEHISHPCCTRCIQYSDFCPLKCLVNEYDWCKWPSNRPHLLKVTTLLSTNIQKIQCQQIICTNFKKSKALYISKGVFRNFDFQVRISYWFEFWFNQEWRICCSDGGNEFSQFIRRGNLYMWNGTPFWNNTNVLKPSQIQSFSSAGNWSSNFRYGFSRLRTVVINTYKYPATPFEVRSLKKYQLYDMSHRLSSKMRILVNFQQEDHLLLYDDYRRYKS